MSEEWPPREPVRAPARLPDHVTTPLLTRITEGSLDEDYRQVALRKAATPATGGRGARSGGPGRPQLIATAVIAVFGVLVTTAAVQTSRNSDVTDAGRQTLIQRVQDERRVVAAEQQEIADLQAANIAAEADLDELTGRLQSITAQQTRDGAQTGFLPVTGPGVQVTITDPVNVTDTADLVRDVDLARLVNGLWEAGAEAISINAQRLTMLSPIRNSYIAIHVNTRPVNPPYVVKAIGNTDTLQADLLDTSLGSRFFDVADQLGFGIDMQNEDRLELPALRGPRLQHVKAGTEGKPGLDDEEANP